MTRPAAFVLLAQWPARINAPIVTSPLAGGFSFKMARRPGSLVFFSFFVFCFLFLVHEPESTVQFD